MILIWNGYKRVPIDPRNMANGVAEIVPPVKGYDLHTTINKNVQQAAEQAILDQIEWVQHNPVSGSVHPHANTGYAVAMEVDTGNVIVMASMPDYDTNVWQSGSAFGGFPYDFARKTGTSQQAYKNKLLDNGVFIAFAPREKPKLAVAVVIPEGGFGAHSAAPVARKIFDAYDREYGLDGNPKK